MARILAARLRSCKHINCSCIQCTRMEVCCVPCHHLSPGSDRSHRPPPAGAPRIWAMLITLCIVLFLDGLDVSMIGVALPSIGAELDLSTSSLQWLVSGYVLGYGGLLLLGGRTADLLRPPQGLPDRAGRLRHRLARRRPGQQRTAADPDPLRQGPGRGVHRTDRALDHHDELRRGPGAQQGAVDLHRVRRRRLLVRPALRRPDDRRRLALDVPAAGADRAGRAGGGVSCCSPRTSRPRKAATTCSARRLSTGAMLLLVYTVVTAPEVGWTSARTVGSFVAVAALVAAFVFVETPGRSTR